MTIGLQKSFTPHPILSIELFLAPTHTGQMPTEPAKRHARTRRGCLTCRIRKKKCDSARPSCTKCERLHVQCLGYASDRPDWLKGECAKGYTQAIKCFLSEYPAAKAYDDPVPYLVLKPTSETERMIASEPGRFNPMYYDPESMSLKKWHPSVPPPPRLPQDIVFSVPSTELTTSQSLPVSTGHMSSPYLPHTPSPQTPYGYPGLQLPVYTFTAEPPQESLWAHASQLSDPYFQRDPFADINPVYSHLNTSGIPAPNFSDPHDGQAVHYVPGPNFLARQDADAGTPCKAGYDALWPTMSGLFY